MLTPGKSISSHLVISILSLSPSTINWNLLGLGIKPLCLSQSNAKESSLMRWVGSAK